MNQNTQTALAWLSLGVSPIPVIYKSKMPAVEWRMWQKILPPKKIITHWFENEKTNIGIICGGKNNTYIIDFDDINSYHDWWKDMSHRDDLWRDVSRRSYKVRTPRGMHVYVRSIAKELSRKYPDTKIDIRCEGNYTLVPPSVHPIGEKYEPIGSISDIVTVDNLSDVFPETIYKQDGELNNNLSIIDLFDPSTLSISDLKSKLNILDYVRQYTQVYRTSTDGRWWMARCIHPMHRDKHPSFRIDTVMQRVKCLSCGCRLYHDIGLDIIDLHKEINGISIAQSIKELGEFYR